MWFIIGLVLSAVIGALVGNALAGDVGAAVGAVLAVGLHVYAVKLRKSRTETSGF